MIARVLLYDVVFFFSSRRRHTRCYRDWSSDVCSSDLGTGGGGGTGGHLTTITVSNNFFSPTPDTVAAGGVTFSWSNASNTHNVTWDSGPTAPANSSTMSTGTFPVTLSQGTYHFHCTVHGAA